MSPTSYYSKYALDKNNFKLKESREEPSFFSNNNYSTVDPIILFFDNLNCYEIPFLCNIHMYSKKKFFTEKMLNGMKKYLPEINSFLFPISKTNFFTPHSLTNDPKKLNLCNFSKKRFCYFSRDETFEPNVLIIDVDRSTKDSLIAIRIFENRKLLAGRFDHNGNLQGEGVCINKKGNVFLGNFVDNQLSNSYIYQMNGLIYKGKVQNFKKYGENEIEIKPDTYQFHGVFENNKRIKGTLTLFNNLHVSSVKLDHYTREILDNYVATIIFKVNDGEIIYDGRVKDRKLNSENVRITKIKQDYSVEYTFEGNVVDNKREGRGIFYWKEDEYFKGTFFNNNPDSVIYPKDNDPENMSIFYSKNHKYCVIFKKGEFIEMKPIDDDFKEIEESKVN